MTARSDDAPAGQVLLDPVTREAMRESAGWPICRQAHGVFVKKEHPHV